jgi:hypothetical protein
MMRNRVNNHIGLPNRSVLLARHAEHQSLLPHDWHYQSQQKINTMRALIPAIIHPFRRQTTQI